MSMYPKGCVLKSTSLLLIGLLFAAPSANADEKAAGKLVVFKLKGALLETPMGDDFLFGTPGAQTLQQVTKKLEKASKDDQVKGLVLMLENFQAGRAQVEELLAAIKSFRDSGKKVHAHTGSLSMGTYLLFTGADEIHMVPTADLWLTGLYGESPYLRGLLDMIGVTPDYLTCGDFKSAAEMFTRKSPSPEAEKMQNWLLDSIFESTVEMIAKGRNTDAETVKKWIDHGPYTAAQAEKQKMIDAVSTLAQFEEKLKSEYGKDVTFDKKYGKKKKPDLDLSNPFAVLRMWSEILQGAQPKKETKDAIAIVTVEGPIVEGSAEASPFGSSGIAMSSPIRKALLKVAEDDSIKALVLRVNSPGGSAVASEIILQASKKVSEKKPVIVSMGDVAGSGGYYVTCAANKIFADKTTITGSIGVVGGKFATSKMWNRIGINFKSYKRGDNAGILSSEDVFTDQEREKIQSWMNEIYAVFKDHVVASRKEKLKKPIDEIAGGRVYTGEQALDLGLIDAIGTLDDAIAEAAKQSDLKDYDIRFVPKPKNFLEMLLEDMLDENGKDDSLVSKQVSAGLWQTILPMLSQVDPARVQLIRTAVGRLELIQKERAVIMMPEIHVGM